MGNRPQDKSCVGLNSTSFIKTCKKFLPCLKIDLFWVAALLESNQVGTQANLVRMNGYELKCF